MKDINKIMNELRSTGMANNHQDYSYPLANRNYSILSLSHAIQRNLEKSLLITLLNEYWRNKVAIKSVGIIVERATHII